ATDGAQFDREGLRAALVHRARKREGGLQRDAAIDRDADIDRHPSDIDLHQVAENGVPSSPVEMRKPPTCHTPEATSVSSTIEPATPPVVPPFIDSLSEVAEVSMVWPAVSVATT